MSRMVVTWRVENKRLAEQIGRLGASTGKESSAQVNRWLSQKIKRRDHCGHGALEYFV